MLNVKTGSDGRLQFEGGLEDALYDLMFVNLNVLRLLAGDDDDSFRRLLLILIRNLTANLDFDGRDKIVARKELDNNAI